MLRIAIMSTFKRFLMCRDSLTRARLCGTRSGAGCCASAWQARSSFQREKPCRFRHLAEKHGINHDPDGVFQVEKGMLHVSGQEFGGLVTQKEFANYYLRAEFKWGEKMYPPRTGKSRDSGIQYNITGPLKVWPRMMEFQINEGGTGDIWVVNGTGMTVGGKVYQSTDSPAPNQYIRIPHIGRGPLVNVTGYRDPVDDLEKPHGEWNLLELVVDHNRVLYFVNGKLANEGTNANPAQGKILFQCEGAEAYFRRMKIATLK